MTAGPAAPDYADPIAIPLMMTIAAPSIHRLDGISRLEPVLVHPANGWPDGVDRGSKPSTFSAANLLGIATAHAQERPSPAEAPIVRNKDDAPVANTIDPGVPVILPNGSTFPDDRSPTGNLMAPVSDLRPVAAAGRSIKSNFEATLQNPDASGGAFFALLVALNNNVGHAGIFDYQRSGNRVQGYVQHRQFRDVSNFNVGLLCQQAGLTLDETLSISGGFAGLFSSNAMPNEPYGLDAETLLFIKAGFVVGESSMFD
jgi:hypothetical protein